MNCGFIKKHRILNACITALVTLIIIAALCIIKPLNVKAATIIDTGDYICQVLEDGKSVTIIQYKGKSLYVSIPSSVEGYTVTAINTSAFMSNETIKELEFPNTVNIIESNAFTGCTGLQKLQIPGNVKTIDSGAFMDCSSLKSVTIYDGTEVIGSFAFSGCKSLTEIKMPNSIKMIDDYAFFNCSDLAELAVPKSVEEFGGYVFEGTKWMQNQKDEFVIIGDGVLIKYTGDAKSKSLSEKIKIIGEYAFAENKDLDTILIPESVRKIGCNAFLNCKGLKTVTLPNSITEIAERAFCGCESLDNVILPGSITKLNHETFKGCKSLSSMDVPPSVSEIDSSAFEDCTDLKNIKLQNGLQKMDSMVFKNCTSLGRLIFPESLKEIEKSAIENCVSLTRAEFNGDTVLKTGSFSDCVNLKEVVFYKNPTNIEDMSFNGSKDVVFYSDNSLYVEEYARRNKFTSENIRNLPVYEDKGIMTAEEKKEQSGFSGEYTFIVVVIILIDLVLIVLFSFYILFVQPKGRHSKAAVKSGSSSGKYARDTKKPVRNINSEKHTSGISPGKTALKKKPANAKNDDTRQYVRKNIIDSKKNKK